MKKHMMHVEVFTPFMARGTVNGKKWRAKFSNSQINIGLGKWFIRSDNIPSRDIEMGELIVVGKELARLDREKP